jgi:hypothetical protein
MTHLPYRGDSKPLMLESVRWPLGFQVGENPDRTVRDISQAYKDLSSAKLIFAFYTNHQPSSSYHSRAVGLKTDGYTHDMDLCRRIFMLPTINSSYGPGTKSKSLERSNHNLKAQNQKSGHVQFRARKHVGSYGIFACNKASFRYMRQNPLS